MPTRPQLTRSNIPWHERRRVERKLGYMSIKRMCKAQASYLGGELGSQDMLEGASWADAFILSRRSKDFYNVTFDSLAYTYNSLVDLLAHERLTAIDRLNPELPEDPLDLWGTPASSFNKPRADLEGLSTHDWIDRERARIADSGIIIARPRIKIVRDYSYGIGLHVTLPAHELNCVELIKFTERFLDGGERAEAQQGPGMSWPFALIPSTRNANPIDGPIEMWGKPGRDFLASRAESQALDSLIARPGAAAPKSKGL